MSRKTKRHHTNPGQQEPTMEPVATRSRFSRPSIVIVTVATVLVVLGAGTLLFKNKGTPSRQLADTSMRLWPAIRRRRSATRMPRSTSSSSWTRRARLAPSSTRW
jgi:hypothetical protein